MKDSKVIKTDDGLAVTIPAEVAERLQLTAGSQVELELTADNKLELTRAEEPIKKMSDSEFWAAVAYAKKKYAKTLQMLAESDRQ
ncbi:AbrB/MazE/SpoVT family DNA-binding domain-containing protein [Lactiplantibacillus pentosus]|uniref:AbrB/MazE/SpoVT family DNA-binding domain-containing protein n=1 Tax=Lactiplantibacillus pentosus TaxID=1589 RepID=UPI001ADDB132|nr:AbrB/MazE/SpoVT family DNA-binding domain-containing protein [Lactiplantibacillus pentosus]MBO9164485.1 AbrB/MazE/SpoVT family DNA-binding domain-containing protein [Lactiplantibacillus pentosus]MCT3310404.1 AbrB/MazE/SpoVT family DNA-binding domain-containing protein [Lactiplantibacillus pentosus]